MKVPDQLQQSKDIYMERNAQYGDNYKKFGQWANELFQGNTPRLETPSDWNRMGVLVQMMSKLSRYVENFNKGGHEDSLTDLITYTAMLAELDVEAKEAIKITITDKTS